MYLVGYSGVTFENSENKLCRGFATVNKTTPSSNPQPPNLCTYILSLGTGDTTMDYPDTKHLHNNYLD